MGRRLVPLLQAEREHPWATERRLRRLVAERRIQYFKIDRRIYFDEADLVAHEEASRVEAV